MGQHLPQTSPGREKPLDTTFVREERPLSIRDPRASRTLVDINELSGQSIAEGTLYNWAYLRRFPCSIGPLLVDHGSSNRKQLDRRNRMSASPSHPVEAPVDVKAGAVALEARDE